MESSPVQIIREFYDESISDGWVTYSRRGEMYLIVGEGPGKWLEVGGRKIHFAPGNYEFPLPLPDCIGRSTATHVTPENYLDLLRRDPAEGVTDGSVANSDSVTGE